MSATLGIDVIVYADGTIIGSQTEAEMAIDTGFADITTKTLATMWEAHTPEYRSWTITATALLVPSDTGQAALESAHNDMTSVAVAFRGPSTTEWFGYGYVTQISPSSPTKAAGTVSLEISGAGLYRTNVLNAATFSTVDDRITVNGLVDGGVNADLTMEFWVKSNETLGPWIEIHPRGNDNDMYVRVEDQKFGPTIYLSFYFGENGRLFVNIPSNVGWNHVAVTWDADGGTSGGYGRGRMYLNGSLVTSTGWPSEGMDYYDAEITYNNPTNTGIFLEGGTTSGTHGAFTVACLRHWSEVRTETQISEHMNIPLLPQNTPNLNAQYFTLPDITDNGDGTYVAPDGTDSDVDINFSQASRAPSFSAIAMSTIIA